MSIDTKVMGYTRNSRKGQASTLLLGGVMAAALLAGGYYLGQSKQGDLHQQGTVRIANTEVGENAQITATYNEKPSYNYNVAQMRIDAKNDIKLVPTPGSKIVTNPDGSVSVVALPSAADQSPGFFSGLWNKVAGYAPLRRSGPQIPAGSQELYVPYLGKHMAYVVSSTEASGLEATLKGAADKLQEKGENYPPVLRSALEGCGTLDKAGYLRIDADKARSALEAYIR